MVTIYHSPTLYRLTTRIGYGPDYAARYTLIADVIRAPGDVLELCCGDLALHRHLEARGLLKSYIGLEHSGAMLKRSEEHTSELQSRLHLVCRLLLEKKKKHNLYTQTSNTAPQQRDRR